MVSVMVTALPERYFPVRFGFYCSHVVCLIFVVMMNYDAWLFLLVILSRNHHILVEQFPLFFYFVCIYGFVHVTLFSMLYHTFLILVLCSIILHLCVRFLSLDQCA